MAKELTATNPETGERVRYDETIQDWVPIQTQTQQLAQRVAEQPFYETLLQGVGRGMSNVARQAGALAGLVTPEELQSYRELEEPLMRTGAGKAGSIGGEVAALAPAAGGLVGLVARGAGALMPAARGVMAATKTGQVGAGAARGAAEGAIEGALLAGPGQRAEGALTGAAFGGAAGGALPAVTSGFRTPSESARTIMAMEPSPDLTPGMMKPGGMVSQLEQAAGSLPIVGAPIRGAAETPQRQFAQAMVNQGRPPGTPIIQPTDVNAMLDEAYTRFEPAYAQLKNFPTSRVIASELGSDFMQASDSRIVAATDDTRKAVRDYLESQTTRLGDDATTGDLLEIRSNIRDQARKAAKSQNWEKAELLEEAENAITERINQSLPEGMAELNQAIDAQYARHKIAESAIYKMGNREFPTPTQWQQAVREATPKGQFARGGGLMRAETQAATDVFKVTEPATGARLLTLAPMAGALAGVGTGTLDPMAATAMGVPLALLAATRGGRRFAVGELPIQQMMQRASEKTMLPGMYARSVAPIAATGE